MFFEQMLKELGVGRAGGNDQHVDPQLGELRSERLAEAAQREFARRVFAFVRAAALAEDRADVHDDRLSALAQQREALRG